MKARPERSSAEGVFLACGRYTRYIGEFDRGDTVRVLDTDGREFGARGITSYSSIDLTRLAPDIHSTTSGVVAWV